MPNNDFLPFAGAVGANVVTQAEWEGLTALLEDGFIAGTARSNQANKLFRQVSIMMAMIASFIVDETGDDVIDDGVAGIAAIQTSFTNAIQNAAAQAGVPYGDDTGTTNNLIADVTPAPGALAEGISVLVKVANTNTGAVVLNLQSFGNKNVQNADGTPLAAGQLTAGGYALFIYDGTQFQMISMPGPAFFASLLAGSSYTAVDTGALPFPSVVHRASATKTTVTSVCPASFCRDVRPRLRSARILVKSSRKPTTPSPTRRKRTSRALTETGSPVTPPRPPASTATSTM